MKKNFLFFIWMLPLVFLSVCSARNNEWSFLSHFIVKYLLCYFAGLHHSSLQISKLMSYSLFSLATCGRLFFSWPPLPAFSRPVLVLVALRYIHRGINKDFSFLLSALLCCQNSVSPRNLTWSKEYQSHQIPQEVPPDQTGAALG